MEAAGTRAGDSFSEGFEARFDKNLSRIGSRFAKDLGDEGRLAGNTFAGDFEGVVQTRFRRIQQNLADILADKDAFADYARGFDNVGDAVTQLETDLDRLRNQTVDLRDDEGKLQEQTVLTWNEFQAFRAEARRLGDEQGALIETERRLAAENRDLEANYARLTRTIGDSDAFKQMADRVGGSETAFRRLKAEVEDTGNILGRSRIEIEEYVDRLERTRAGVDRVSESTVVLENRTTRLDRAFVKLGHVLAKPWNNLDRDVRLVIGLIASAGDQVAVLGSALGAGLIAVGAAAAQGVIGVGGLAAVFVTLGKEIDELPPDLRDVAREFAGLKQSLSGAREVIASSAFQNMDGVFDSLANSVRQLSPEFDSLGDSVGKVFDKFATSVKPNTEAFREIAKLVDNSGDGFERLADTAGTFGLAFIRSFNRAQPLVEDLYDWVDQLATRFDEFSRGDGFDIWIKSAQNVFGSFGQLLDEVGRGLNDLASPAAVQRTTDLLDNLSGFIPNLTALLDILGRLDPLGLIAQLLNDIGAALEPLAEPTGELAEALNRVLSVSFESFATGLNALSTLLAPVVQGFTNFLNVIPDEALGLLSSALIASVGAFAIFRGAQGIAGAITALGGFTTKAIAATGASAALGSSISKGLGKAGLAGAAVVGVLALSDALNQLYRSATNVEDTSRNLVASNASLEDAYEALGGSVFGVLPPLTDVDAALDNLTGSNVEGMLGALGNAFRVGGGQANALSQSLGELSKPLANLAMQDLPAASSQFSAWTTELGASDQQVLNMLDTMPEFKQVLIDTALATGVAATDQNILALALGTTSAATTEASTGMTTMGTSALVTSEQIDDLSSRISNFGSTVFGARDAARDYEAALDDLTTSLAENGATLDITTEQGRANEAAVDALAQSILENTSNTLENTKSTAAATQVMEQGRAELVKSLQQFGLTEEAANAYADQLGLIPENVTTEAELTGVAAAEYQLEQLARNRTAYIDAVITNSSGNDFFGSGGVNRPGFASGGILTRATNITAGEAGVEGIVPFDRPLSQVDPSVRWLSAIAQGKSMQMASGGIVGGGQHIDNIDITVVSPDPDRAGDDVLRALSENLNG